MNKRELIEAIAGKVDGDVSRKDVESTINALTALVGETLKKGGEVAIPQLGKFVARKRSARTARNPQTGAPVKVKAATVPAFKAAQGLKDAVAGAKKGAAKKASAKKGAAKKAPAKKGAANKGAAKKGAAKKAPAKKTSAKKAPAKKAPAKKTSAKKAPAKKTTARKTTAKKTTAKKATAKKTARKR